MLEPHPINGQRAVGIAATAPDAASPVQGPGGAFALQFAAIIGTLAILVNLDCLPDHGLAFPAVAGLLLLGAVGDRRSAIGRRRCSAC